MRDEAVPIELIEVTFFHIFLIFLITELSWHKERLR